jgi:hypothetical protein
MAGRRGIAGWCVALAALVLPGCGGLFGTDAVIQSAHVVFLTRDDCAHVVTNRNRASFAVLGLPDGFDARQGDLVVGNLGTGPRLLDIVPFREQSPTRTLSFEVVDHDLSLAEAQDLYYGFCPLPPSAIPAGTPGFPLAPDTTDAPPDTTGTF